MLLLSEYFMFPGFDALNRGYHMYYGFNFAGGDLRAFISSGYEDWI